MLWKALNTCHCWQSYYIYNSQENSAITLLTHPATQEQRVITTSLTIVTPQGELTTTTITTATMTITTRMTAAGTGTEGTTVAIVVPCH